LCGRHATCQEGSEDGPNLSNKQLLGCNEIATHQISIPSEVILVRNLSDSSNASIVKDSVTSTREMLREMILYFMDSEFPRLPVPECQDCTLSSSEVYDALLQHLLKKQVQLPSTCLGYTDVDDFLCKTLVYKLQITKFDDGYEPMTLLGLFLSLLFQLILLFFLALN
jgi:hypothetical protein